MSTRAQIASSAALLVAGAALAYGALRFPDAPRGRRARHSLAALGPASPHWAVYPEDFFPGGAYVELPHGRTRYWVFGPEDGKRVVLVHGISTPSIMWEYTARGLVERGYRVLVYDLWGRGYSDAPDAKHDTALYTSQLALLLQHVGWPSACIAGVSMGGAIAVAFATTFPQLTSSVALLCPAGLMAAADVPRATRLLTAPLLRPVFRTLTARKAGAVPDAALAAVVRAQAALLPAFPGVLAASFREGPVRGLESRFARLGELARSKQTRVLLIWGTADQVVPFRYAQTVREYIPDAEFVEIADAPHELPRSNPGEVVDALDAFFRDA